ncbi:hypothetical protein TNCV_4233001 [Trichonephila clavipes]|nr:hypothetical protein TNCV_4233001 [Trichonephila clavipes]
MEIDHKPESGRPLRCDVNHLRQKIEVLSISTVRQLEARLFASPETISRYLAAMDAVKKLETWIPHALAKEQHLRLLETCKSLQEREAIELFLHHILTVDKKWVLCTTITRAEDNGCIKVNLRNRSPKNTSINI